MEHLDRRLAGVEVDRRHPDGGGAKIDGENPCHHSPVPTGSEPRFVTMASR